jgi:hypothetical protein
MNVEPVNSASGAARPPGIGEEPPVQTGKPPRGFPGYYSSLTPVGKLSWLAGEECQELLSTRRLQRQQVQVEERRLRKSASRIATLVPSPARLEEFWRGYPFPPPGAKSPMCRAAVVLDESERPVLWPANYLSGTGATYDVIVYQTECRRAALELKPHRGESSSQSPSAEALRVAETTGAILDTGINLLTEDEHVLKQQIDRYLAGKKTSLMGNDD